MVRFRNQRTPADHLDCGYYASKFDVIHKGYTHLRSNNGFSLPEVMVAMFIFGFVLLALGSQIGVVLKAANGDKMLTTATILLQDKFEVIKNTNFNQINSGNDSVVRMGVSFQRSWTAVPYVNMKTVEITVQWNNKSLKGNTVVSDQ